MNSGLFKVVPAMLAVALLAGCTGIRDHRGHVLDKELAAAVQVGVDNKTSVAKTLGRPTFTGQFNENEWYYLARDTSTMAFRTAKVVDQTVLRVRFDPAGNVAAVDRMGKELIASVNPSDDLTPTLGRKRGFFEDLFGNIGTVGQGLPGQGQQGQGRRQ